MAKFEEARIRSIILAGFFGVLVAFLCVPLLGISSAIAAPRGLFSWAQSVGVLEPALFAWEIAVVGGLGLALPAVAALAVLRFAYPVHRMTAALSCLGGVFLGHCMIVPLVNFESPLYILNRHWWSFGQELSLAIVLGIMCAASWSSRITTRWSGP